MGGGGRSTKHYAVLMHYQEIFYLVVFLVWLGSLGKETCFPAIRSGILRTEGGALF